MNHPDIESFLATMQGMLDNEPEITPTSDGNILVWELHGQRLTVRLPLDEGDPELHLTSIIQP